MPAASRSVVCALMIGLCAPGALAQAAGGDGGALPPAEAAVRMVDVGPKLVRNAEMIYVIEENVVSKLESAVMERGSAEQRVSRTIRVRFVVKAIGEQGTQVEMTYQRIAQKISSDLTQQALAFDTDAPAAEQADNPLMPAIRPLLGAPIMLTIGQSGAITDVDAPASLIPNIPAARAAVQYVDAAAIATRFGDIFSTSSPGPKQAVGATWTNITKTTGPTGTDAKMVTESVRTLESADDAVANIKLKATARIEGAEQNQGPKVELKDFAINGDIRWRTFDGRLETARVTTHNVTVVTPQPDVTQTITIDESRAITREK